MAEFFDQNPISQMAILITREGSAERLSPLSGAFRPTFFFLNSASVH